MTNKILKSIIGYQITDSQCGFKAFFSDIAHFFLNIPYNDYTYESEFIYQASKKGVIIEEKPITCFYKDEKSHITWINVLNYTLFLLKLFLRELKWRIKH